MVYFQQYIFCNKADTDRMNKLWIIESNIRSTYLMKAINMNLKKDRETFFTATEKGLSCFGPMA